ncbi:MAG: hypothetical protein EOP14_05045 [Pseudomonas sp.]|nr:MAG: hypothetical protein EOP14_05045 [Pseudomonas sp.]
MAQRDVLTAVDCDELQGYFYAKPMAAASLARWALERTYFSQVDGRASHTAAKNEPP